MDDNFDEKLGAVLRSVRESKNISQPEMARRLGVTKMTISHWETGKRFMHANKVKKYCDALGVTVQSVFDMMEE